jgi:hypothetical protein
MKEYDPNSTTHFLIEINNLIETIILFMLTINKLNVYQLRT